MRSASFLLLLICSVCAFTHPMGNFSINHYARLELGEQGEKLTYILDFAEIPTSELFGEWGSAASSSDALQQSAARQAEQWAQKLTVSINSKVVPVRWKSVQASTTDGAGGMPVLRVVMISQLAAAGSLQFRDENYANRTGWKEIVIKHEQDVHVEQATNSERDLSQALTIYPADLTVTPPQDLSASVTWRTQPVVAQSVVEAVAAVAGAKSQHVDLKKNDALSKLHPGSKEVPAVIPTGVGPAVSSAATPASFSALQPEVAGTVTRGDYLSRMLKQKHFGISTILFGLLVAFGLGAMHALSPGHGKTIVAAYLVGSRGTIKHAGILGMTVTFTHTVSVFLLGIGVLFFQKYVIPEKVVPILGAISGLSIVVIGAYLLYQRSLALAAAPTFEPNAEEPRARAHSHAHARSHSHAHSHAHSRSRSNVFAHTHMHDGHSHTHTVPDQITLGSLLGLGVSGGLVPCPSALVLLLSAISLGQVAIGLALLSAFSAGLAVVLIAVGGLVLYGKNLLPKKNLAANHPLIRLVPLFSSVVVIVVGLLMTLTAIGIIQPVKLLT